MTAVIDLEQFGLSAALVEYFQSDLCSVYLAFHPELLEALGQVKRELSDMELSELVKALEYYAERNTASEINLVSPFSGFGDWFSKAFSWILWGCLIAVGVWVLALLTPYLIELGKSLGLVKRAKTDFRVAKLDYETNRVKASSDVDVAIIKQHGFEHQSKLVTEGSKPVKIYEGE